MAQDDAFKLTEEMAAKYSYEIKSELQAARVTSESLMTVFKTLIENGEADRDTLNNILINSLKQKDYIISFCVAFEPNKLDGKDAEYAGHPLYGESGRYAPYWSLQDGEIDVEPLTDIDDEDWYAGARDSGAEYITDPFFYEVQGTPVLMTSLVFPIIIDGEFIGIVSSDMALDSLQEMVSYVNTSGLGEFTEIYSNSGVVVAHPEDQYFNKSIYATSAYNMLAADPSKAQQALTIANEYVENNPIADEEDEAQVEEYDNAVAFASNLGDYAQDSSGVILDLTLLTDGMARELLQLDGERMRVAQEAMKAVEDGESYTVTQDDYYTVYMPIRFSEATNPWSVAVNVPMSEVLLVSNEIQRYVLIICIIAIAIIACILFIIANRITKPILNLAKVAGQFGEGHFDVELPPVRSNDEIGTLSGAFKGMAERINSLINTLQNYAAELEENNEHLNYLNETLVATNHVSETILNVEHQQFHDVLNQSLRILGESVHANGVSIWENDKHSDGKVYSRVISTWIANQAGVNAVADTAIDLDRYLPGWDEQAQKKDGAGSSVLDGSAILAEFELFHDFRSLLLMPLMLHDSYWGFLVFAYAEAEYQLKNDESEILRSSGMMLASAILQNETAESLMEAETMASTDPLTGLTNRNGFLIKAPAVYAECRKEKVPLTLLFFDLDHFKRVNDEFGHPFGDEVLKAFARVIEEETGERDVCCRYGGEEFILLLNNSDGANGKETAERILERVRYVRLAEKPNFSFTVSIGMVAGVPGIHDTLNGYIQKADNALYAAKENGRDQLVVFPYDAK
ncbi:diguanylate cyclase [Christensenellaceae bacterium OttesenSCG-928-K19]|nr:diguanylate cyclase [Christensenellaceae bacterium OttesenSCG-928-K19]